MPETKTQKVKRWRGERNERRAANKVNRQKRNALNKRIAAVDGRIRKLNAAIKKALEPDPTKGQLAARYLLKYVGKTESPPGSNDAPFLREWENNLPHNRLDWMIPGQPWCGFAVIAGWYYGAGKLLPDGVVYTPNIVNWAHSGQGFQAVRPADAKAGDLVVFNFPGGSGVADHVGLALGPAVNGVIQTVEGNTSSNDGGSQSNGGGVFQRSRSVSQIAVVARPK